MFRYQGTSSVMQLNRICWMILGVGLLFSGTSMGQETGTDSACICNPEDNNTGSVCANDGKTYTSACDFRLKQGLRSDLGIRCVGSCPCDDSLIGVGVDCGTTAISQLTTPSSGLEFCGTNAVTYNNENMFMCDQVQDASLAISCPGSCPCQLADCPSLATAERPLSRVYQTLTTPPPRLIVYPPASVIPGSYNRQVAPVAVTPALQTGYGSIQAQGSGYGGYGTRVSDSVPAVIVPIQPASPSYTQAAIPWSAPAWTTNRSPLTVLQQNQGGVYQPPVLQQQQGPTIVMQSRAPSGASGYGGGSFGGGEPKLLADNEPPVTIVQPAPQIKDLQVREKAATSEKPEKPSPALPQAAYNPLTEALRSVPFRLFRHLYILITVASEGMKQIPFQIAKNMQARLPPYVREIPMQLAEATQEALAIHFDSLARQIKDTVDAVRTLLDNDNS
ncbi:hypothetical protein BV898_01529 [Hypsibius exemplaris]|uniref:Kazal-like domain-containing protein n=1 Tax=Hypsibius exemplaris TaxID=2072580 RepID=A0A1W0XAA8_HYPEX|nr:hypothetical protein BV898_01529 [Hypsibius exemplaris]